MRPKKSLTLLLVLAGLFVAFVLVFETKRPTSPAAPPPVVQRSPRANTEEGHSAATEIRPVVVASVENTERRRREASARDLQAGRAASFEIVSTIYGPLLDKLQVSPEVRKQFLELVCNERQAAYDVVSTANRENLVYLSNPDVQRMALAAATSEDAKIRELLPADDFDQFFDYRNMRTIQLSVAKLVDTIAESGGTPLSNAQLQALVKVFADAQTPGQLLRAPINAVLNLSGVGITDPIVDAARSVLSDQQFAALLQVRAAQSVPSHDKIGAPPRPAGGH